MVVDGSDPNDPPIESKVEAGRNRVERNHDRERLPSQVGWTKRGVKIPVREGRVREGSSGNGLATKSAS